MRAAAPKDAAEVADAVRRAIRIEQQRDLATDAAYGIEQLAVIGWTSVSTAKSNPSPGIMVIHSLRDLLARWSAVEAESRVDAAAKDKVCVVNVDDVFEHLLNAFETMAVVASDSMQPQTAAEVYRNFAVMFEHLPAEWRPRTEDAIRRSLTALGDHVLTCELNEALTGLIVALEAAGRIEPADQVRAAHAALSASVGRLGSRATRVPENQPLKLWSNSDAASLHFRSKRNRPKEEDR